MPRTRITQIIISAAILIFFLVGAYYYIIRESRNRTEAAARGHIVHQQEWPQPFVDLLKDAKQRNIKVDNINVYWSDYYGSGYWVSEASPEFFTMISERWKLQPVEENHKVVRRFYEIVPTKIEIPNHSNDIYYYLNPNWLAGEKNELYCVIFDKANKVVIIRYYFNW